MNLIVAVDNNWAIGCKGTMLFRLPEDLKHFQSETSGSVVVMGRKTLVSLPRSAPLKNRTNIVITTDKSFEAEGAKVCHSVDDALALIKKYEKDGQQVYIIGGETIYKQFLPYTNKAIITHIDATADNADTFFPDLSAMPNWEKVSETDQIEDNGTKTSYACYKNINVKSF